MFKDNRILAVIPARGGSKGLPKKNIKELNGKPLIYYTIKAASKSRFLDEFVVSTDDDEIEEVARNLRARVIRRPPELARDESPSYDALNHSLSELKKEGGEFDIIIMLEPTSPLRKDDDIDEAIKTFCEDRESNSLVSLGEVGLEHPYIVKEIKQGYVKPMVKVDLEFHQRQQLPTAYFPYGVIYLSKIQTYLKEKTFYQDKTVPYFIERWQKYEIDDIYDLKTIEAIIKYRGDEVEK